MSVHRRGGDVLCRQASSGIILAAILICFCALSTITITSSSSALDAISGWVDGHDLRHVW